jgi:predicted nucleic acid-binding protein
MKVFFDSSALVPVVTDQLPSHEASLARFVAETGAKSEACTSTHALAECYAVLTALPLKRRISGPEALQLIEDNFIDRLRLVSLSSGDYRKALRLASASGGSSGMVYDALHVAAALKEGCARIYTHNVKHFRRLAPNLEVMPQAARLRSGTNRPAP